VNLSTTAPESTPPHDGTPPAATPSDTSAVAQPPTTSPPTDRIYFPELDGLRFVAFALVYIFHGGVPQWSGWVRTWRSWLHAVLPTVADQIPADIGFRLQSNGWAGVQLFFLLSGFLITTLLMRERARFGRLDLKAFWVRRILRIWPLYYLTIVLTFFVLQGFDGAFGTTQYGAFLRRHLLPFLAFMGNWSMGLGGPVASDAISILWSVCVEEQFYILAPLLLAFVPRHTWVAAVVLMVCAIGNRYWLATHGASPLLFQYSTLTQLDTLLAGVLLGLMFCGRTPGSTYRRVMMFLQWPLLAFIVWVFIRPNLAHVTVAQQTWDFVLLWLACAALILVAISPKGWLNRILSYSRIVWLGKISYGLYMYHEIAFWIARRIFGALGWFPNDEIIQTIATFAITVTMAGVSYHYFERPFLKLKYAWTRVPSRPV
jgi:peptidoglycan/LPS O-acetylase OafA/YrhL